MAVLSAGAAPDALRSAVDKLQRVIAPDAESVTVDIGSEPESAIVLRSAVTSGAVVTITYTSLGSGETTTRDVEPWAVFSTMGNWYLNGYCRKAQAERVFRLDRIREIAVTDERFDRPAVPPSPEVRYSPSVEDVTATIRLSPAAAWVADYYPVTVLEDGPEGKLVEFSATDPLVTARLLLRLGSTAQLTTGDEVAAATSDLRERIATRYQ
jgi:proteasome accessory factor C